MTNNNDHKLKQEINQLEDTMHDADQYHTLEEQVADMKRRGIDPSSTYKKWDDEKKEWIELYPKSKRCSKHVRDINLHGDYPEGK